MGLNLRGWCKKCRRTTVHDEINELTRDTRCRRCDGVNTLKESDGFYAVTFFATLAICVLLVLLVKGCL